MQKRRASIDIPNLVLDLQQLDLGAYGTFYLKYCEDLENRVIWLDEEVNDELLYEIVHYIIKWNREDRDISEIDRKPIKILFNSPGGSLDAQAAICSVIELSKTPIVGIAIGLVASAASLIFLSCHVRLALKSSYFILHKGSATLNGDFENIMSSIDDYKKEVEKMVNFIVEKSSFTKEEVEEHINKDWYVRSSEALNKGLVDQIITDINVLL